MRPVLVAAVALVAAAPAACAHAPARRPSPHASQHLAAGIAALAADDLDRAEAELHLALEYEPRQAEAMNGLGLVAMARGDRAGARRWFRAALRANPEMAEAHANLGAVELDAGGAEAALPHLQAALDLDPGYLPARHNVARALATLGRLDEAREEYMKLTSTARDRADGWAELAAVELALGRRAAAGRAARTALALEPTHHLARRVNADLLRDGGELEAALAAYDDLLGEAPSDADALVGRGVTLLVAGRTADARRDLERAVAVAPRSPQARFALGAALVELGEDERAADELAHAARLAAEAGRAYPEAHYLRAGALQRLGRRKEAIDAYRQFLREADEDATLADAVADARTQLAALSQVSGK